MIFTWPLFTILAVTTMSVTGLLAIWVGLGRGHWFARTIALAGWLSAWLIVPAYELVAVLLVESLLVIAVLAPLRRRRRPPGEPFVRFTLADLLLLVVVVAAITAAMANVPSAFWTSWGFRQIGFKSPVNPTASPWSVFLVQGLLAGTVVLLAFWTAFGKSPHWAKGLLLSASMAVAFPLCLAGLMYFWHYPITMPFPGYSVSDWVFDMVKDPAKGYATTVGLVATWLGLAVVVRRATNWKDRRSPKWAMAIRVAAVLLLAVLTLVLAVPPVGLLIALATPPPIPPRVELPEPNGYDAILKTAAKLRGVSAPVDDPYLPASSRPGPAVFRAFRRKYGGLLTDLRAALDMKCQFPVSYMPDYSTDVSPTPNVELRELVRAVNALGHAAMLDGDPETAVRCDLDVVRLGQALQKGSMSIDLLIGEAIENMGLAFVHQNLPALTATSRRDLAARLRTLECSCEPLAEVLRRGESQNCRAYGWQGHLVELTWRWDGTAESFERSAIVGRRTRAAYYAILLNEIALADYRAKHGRYPHRLEELMPEALDRLPGDPFRKGPLVYRATKKGYILYSVGENGVDDGRCQTISEAPPRDDVSFDY